MKFKQIYVTEEDKLMWTILAIFGVLSFLCSLLVLLALAGASRASCMERDHERGRETMPSRMAVASPMRPAKIANPAAK
jgi:hypothetical protein